MGHIHTKNGQYDFTIGAYIVRKKIKKYEVLLHLHKKLKKLLPIGGHIELNESPWSAVAHELYEEAGYHLSDLLVLQPKDAIHKLTDVVVQPQPLVVASYDYDETHNHTDMAFVFIEKNPPSSKPNEGESLDINWISADNLKTKTSEDIFINTKEIYTHILEQCIDKWDAIEASQYSITN